jgi:hypothetical protein
MQYKTNIHILITFLLLLLFGACTPDPPLPPPTADDLYQVRDSIRTEMLFRLGKAKLEINRQAEMMRRRAYSEPAKKARQLRKDAERMEKAYTKVDNWITTIETDSTMGEWYANRQKMNILLEHIGHSLNTIF